MLDLKVSQELVGFSKSSVVSVCSEGVVRELCDVLVLMYAACDIVDSIAMLAIALSNIYKPNGIVRLV